jgi:hypothetical protein
MYQQEEQKLEVMFAVNLAVRTHLQDPSFLNAVIEFYDWTALWIREHQLRMQAEEKARATAPAEAAPAAPPASAASAAAPAPEASAPPKSLSSLIPEPIVETMSAFFQYLGRFQSEQLHQLPQSSYAHILTLVLSLAAGPFALKNPHLRSSLAEFLLCLLPQDRQPSEAHVFATHPQMLQSLVPTLLEMYVSLEEGRGTLTCEAELPSLAVFLSAFTQSYVSCVDSQACIT